MCITCASIYVTLRNHSFQLLLDSTSTSQSDTICGESDDMRVRDRFYIYTGILIPSGILLSPRGYHLPPGTPLSLRGHHVPPGTTLSPRGLPSPLGDTYTLGDPHGGISLPRGDIQPPGGRVPSTQSWRQIVRGDDPIYIQVHSYTKGTITLDTSLDFPYDSFVGLYTCGGKGVSSLLGTRRPMQADQSLRAVKIWYEGMYA